MIPVRQLLLAIIITIYAALALGYSMAVPLWEAPDEPSHYLYALHLIEQRSLPPAAPRQSGRFYENGYVVSLYEWYQPPLYYGLLVPQLSALKSIWPAAAGPAFPAVNMGFTRGESRLFANSGIAAPMDIGLTGPRLARYFSVVLGVCMLLMVYRVARKYAPDDDILALTVTGFTAFIPQFTFLTAYITNDNLANLVSATSLLAIIHLIQSSETRFRTSVLILALVAAVGLLSKLSLLFVFPLGVTAIVLRQFEWSPKGIWNSARYTLLFMMAAFSLAFLCGLLIPGTIDRVIWAQTTLPPRARYVSFDYVMGLWPITLESFWGRFGWMNVKIAAWIAPALNLLAAVGLCSSALLLFQSHTLSTSSRRVMVLMFCNCLLVLAAFVVYNFADTQPQGRYLYPAIAAFAVLVCGGLLHLGNRLRAAAGLGLVLTMFGINLISLFGYLVPAYHSTIP
jgi:hypothetical protein